MEARTVQQLSQEVLSVRDIIPTLLMTAAALLCLAVMSVTPPTSGVMLVQFNPFASQNDHVGAIVSADALLVGTGKLPGSFLVASEKAGLPERLHNAGALAVVDPYGATGCGAAGKARWKSGLGQN